MMEAVEDKKLHLPPEIEARCRYHEEIALGFIQGKDYSSAEKEYKNLLSEIIKAQGDVTRYHKGAPYHQIGYCLLLRGENDAARICGWNVAPV